MFRLLGKKIIAFYTQNFCLTGPMEEGLDGGGSGIHFSLKI